MERLKGSDESERIDGRTIGHSDIISKIRSGQVITTVISNGNELSLYLEVGLATGFKVEQIADEGEDYPAWRNKRPRKIEDQDRKLRLAQKRILVVENTKVKGEGYIAVSIERPKGTRDFSPFWNKLESLGQKKV